MARESDLYRKLQRLRIKRERISRRITLLERKLLRMKKRRGK